MDPAKRPLFPIYDIMEHWAAFVKGTPEVKPVHHALYHALVQMCKQRHGTQRFNLNYLDGMEACSIHSRTTYLAALRDLEGWGFATYTPGANGIKAPIVAVIFCASAEHQLSIYRASAYTSADTSAEHTIKEVKGLRLEVNEKALLIERLEKELNDLKTNPAQPKPAAMALALSDDLTTRLAALTDTSGEIIWRESILTKPDYFAKTARKLVAADVDVEHYRKAALIAAEVGNLSRDIKGWESWVSIYFTNQLQRGKLLTCTAGGTLPSQPTPFSQYPEPGHEQPGQVFYIGGSPGDQNQDKMAAYARLKHYPAATIVSLAYPQNPYTLQNGTPVRA